MRSFFVAAAIVASTTATVAYATGPEPTPLPIVVVDDSRDWAGGYFGGGFFLQSMTAEDLSYGPGPFSPDGAGAFAFGGFNFQPNGFVFGVEVMASAGGARGSDGSYLLPLRVRNSVGARVLAGPDLGNVRPFVSLGVSRTSVDADHAGLGVAADIETASLSGRSIGVGADIRTGDSGFLRVELLHTRNTTTTIDFYAGTDPHGFASRSTQLNVGWGMLFN